MPVIKITATIITFNEEKKIEPCIQSLVGIADEIIVVDSFSTDNTAAICGRYPVKFVQHKFGGHVAQKNYAMELASYHFILSLDADERLSDELKKSILAIKNDWGDKDGYIFKRFNNYCGQWMRYSGWYDKKIRLWDRRTAKWGGTDPHDFIHLPKSRVKKMNGDLIHYAYFTIDEHISQVYKFADIAARAKYKKGERPSFLLNVILSPMIRFVRCFFFQLGFLDGYYGYIVCKMAATLTFLKYLKLYEYCRKGLPEEQEANALQELR